MPRIAVKCLACSIDRHADCDRHMNDHAVDAEEFIPVRCDCPCEGAVPRDGRLIELVKQLREDADRLERELSDVKRSVAEMAGDSTALGRAVEEFLRAVLSDEGEVRPYARGRWDHEVLKLAAVARPQPDSEEDNDDDEDDGYGGPLPVEDDDPYADDDGLHPSGPGGRIDDDIARAYDPDRVSKALGIDMKLAEEAFGFPLTLPPGLRPGTPPLKAPRGGINYGKTSAFPTD